VLDGRHNLPRQCLVELTIKRKECRGLLDYPKTTYDFIDGREVSRILRLERDRLKRRIHREELNAVVPPAGGGDGLLGVVLLDGEPAAVLDRAECRELHEHDPALAQAHRTRVENGTMSRPE